MKTFGNKRSILLLGGSKQQVVAIEAAKRLGYRTVLCDYLPDNPGQHAADVFYRDSTTDSARILEIARDERVDGVLAYASDPAASTAAYVANELGLPSNPLSSVEILGEKHRFREHLAQNGFPCPMSTSFPVGLPAEKLLALADHMTYPVVIKPTDSSGSKGISVISSPSLTSFVAACRNAARFSRNGILVLEEYIAYGFPRVIGGDVFVVNGEVRFWGLMSCFRDAKLGGLVPVGERWPSGLTKDQNREVQKQIQRLVSSLRIQYGELNVEIIIGADGRPYFLELGARAGGNMIPVQLSDISGIDLVEANVRYAMGDFGLDVSFESNDSAYCTYVLHARASGRLEAVEFDREFASHVYRQVTYIEPGSHVERFDGANKAIGILFLSFESVGQMESIMDRVDDLVSVRLA